MRVLKRNPLQMCALAGLLVLSSYAHAQELNKVFENRNTVAYRGYQIMRSFDRNKGAFGRSRTVVTRVNARVATIDGWGHENATRFALFPLLGNGQNQLIVESYSGGAHCCTAYHIYELVPRFRVLFDGKAYSPDDVGYSMNLADLNHDGVYEFVQNVMNFDYFYASHARSVFPEVVFAYDRRNGKFRPANRPFSDYLLRNIREKTEAAQRLNDDLRKSPRADDVMFRQEYHHAFLEVTLTYMFAGRDKAGWRFFEQEYKLSDKSNLRSDLRRTLRGSTVYRSIRG